jgi:hypothetical protein
MSEIDFNELQKRLAYDPDTGIFNWLIASSNVKPGMQAGTPNTKGYIQIKVKGQRYFAHKLAWLFTYGIWPTKVVDHINGITSDNRISNLRLVTASENMHNQRRPQRRTKSGYLGVSWVASRKMWQAGLGVDGKFKFLGLFTDPKLAHEAYLAAKRIHHPSAPVR